MVEQRKPAGSGPLAGIKVIELAHIMAGPVCGLMLADMGADVIKVEKVPGGDDSRRMLPPAIEGESAAFMMMNRNKRGIALDLKTEDGKAVLHRLLRDADVVIENYRRGTMEKLGFGYEAMREINPGIIYCEISGFGRTGPLADAAGFDLIAQGMSGLMSITGEGHGRPPVKVGAPVTDISAGLLACMGVMAALVERGKTGQGQKVDTSLFEAGIIQTYWQSAIRLATGVSPGPMGSAHPLNAPYQAFPTADGWINVGAANQSNWLRLLDAIEAPELAQEPRFAANPGRMGNLDELTAVLNAIFKRRTTADWLAVLERAGVPAGPVLTIAEMHDHPQTRARDMVVKVEHEKAGPVETLGLPIKFSRTPGSVRRGAPTFGQDSRALLAELGYGEEEIDRLAGSGAIG
ncbi:crotonobetainyl-CoA:carnitine CoA-transferase CaiB-like acyl-CoA transferase [Skermanella aerolata]|uniref:CoA transferase n=1 Tax=Skermanella aerolata TaxID=393310 RepID=A0A512DMQ1_9PROT|nr:CoA transferase [Skermanella aerolata]KJB96622.1 CoA transferase [Skermanella aerolata KACC 11604]GEO37738.1 CoA transferase [Skermanella aerolata]